MIRKLFEYKCSRCGYSEACFDYAAAVIAAQKHRRMCDYKDYFNRIIITCPVCNEARIIRSDNYQKSVRRWKNLRLNKFAGICAKCFHQTFKTYSITSRQQV